MNETLSVEQAQQRFDELIARVEQGEEFYVTRNKKIVAKLAKASNNRPKFGELKPSFVGVDTDLIDQPDEVLNRKLYE